MQGKVLITEQTETLGHEPAPTDAEAEAAHTPLTFPMERRSELGGLDAAAQASDGREMAASDQQAVSAVRAQASVNEVGGHSATFSTASASWLS